MKLSLLKRWLYGQIICKYVKVFEETLNVKVTSYKNYGKIITHR